MGGGGLDGFGGKQLGLTATWQGDSFCQIHSLVEDERQLESLKRVLSSNSAPDSPAPLGGALIKPVRARLNNWL